MFLLQYFAKLLPQLEADYWVPAGSGFVEFFEKLNENSYGFFFFLWNKSFFHKEFCHLQIFWQTKIFLHSVF